MSDDKKKADVKVEAKEEAKKAAPKKEAAKKSDKKPAKVKKEKLAAAHLYDIISNPVVTEKSQLGAEFNKITFNVAPYATKTLVKEAVESIFGAKVDKVNVINVKGKTKRFRGTLGRRKDVKKAVVTLAEGQNIDIASAA